MITAYLIGSTFITVMMNGTSHTIASDHKKFEEIKQAIKENNLELVEALINVKKSLINYTHGKILITDDVVTYDGHVIKSSLVDRIIHMMQEGFNADSMLKFLENLMQNPSHQAVQELYLFLEAGQLPITVDGHFLAYKKVQSNYMDFYTQTIDHSIGKIVTMPRYAVDDDRNRTCSSGLHFCSLNYLPHYHGNQGRVVIVKINPADVVSIPSDYSNTKGRTCRYEVIGEYTGPEAEHAFNSPVYDNMTPMTSQSDENPSTIASDYDFGYAAGCEDAENGVLWDDNDPEKLAKGQNWLDGYRDGYDENQ